LQSHQRGMDHEALSHNHARISEEKLGDLTQRIEPLTPCYWQRAQPLNSLGSMPPFLSTPLQSRYSTKEHWSDSLKSPYCSTVEHSTSSSESRHTYAHLCMLSSESSDQLSPTVTTHAYVRCHRNHHHQLKTLHPVTHTPASQSTS